MAKRTVFEGVELSSFTIEFAPTDSDKEGNTNVTIVIVVNGRKFSNTKRMWLLEVNEYLSNFGVKDL